MIDNTLVETEPRVHGLLQARVVHEIVVLERGMVIERGDHDNLVRAGGVYASLVREN